MLLVFRGCVENISDSDSTKPSITLLSPLSGDTVEVGSNEISYTASDASGGSGLSSYEVFINGESNEVYSQNDDDTNPDLYLTVDSTLVNTKISYFVTVYNESGAYKSSETQTGLYVRENTDPPEAPYDLTLSWVSDTEILLVWQDSSDIEEGFEIWRKVGDADFALLTELSENTTSFRDQGLSSLVIYQYKVRAFNEYGYSAFTTTISSTGGESNAPTNLEAEALGASIVYLTWQDNSLLENGFRIERKTISESDWTVVGYVGANEEEFTDDQDLSPSATYQYRVAALLSDNEVYSGTVQVTTASSDIPSPGDLVASFDASINAVVVEWVDETKQENGTIIERKNGSGDDFIEIGTTDTDVNTFEDYSVEPENVYTYRAQHTTTEGINTPYSNTDTAFVPQLLPATPQNLTIFVITENQEYGLTWEYSDSEEIDGFELWMLEDTDDASYSLFETLGASRVATSVTLPDTSKDYFFKIRAFSGTVYSKFSSEVGTSGESSDFTLTASETTSDSVVLEWNDPFDDEYGFRVQRLSVTASETEYTNLYISGSGSGGTLSYTDDDINQGVTYQYRIQAILSIEIVSSNEVEVTIPVN